MRHIDTSDGDENESWVTSAKTLAWPSDGYRATPVLAWVNIAVFVLMAVAGVSLFDPSAQTLFEWGGAVRGAVIQDGDYWRIVSSCFVHAGIIHLLMNIYGLIMAGALLEPIIGWKRLALTYFLTGSIGVMASIAVNDNVVTVGASGAIFGLFGAFLALLFTDYFPKEARLEHIKSMAIFIFINILAGVRSKGEIDMAGHAGGLASGIIIGGLFYLSLRNPENVRRANLTTAAAVITCSVIAFLLFSSASTSMDRDQAEILAWKKDIDLVGFEERKALGDESTGAYHAAGFRYRRMAQMLNKMQLHDVPSELRLRTELLEKYSTAKAEIFEYKARVQDGIVTEDATIEERLTANANSLELQLEDSAP